MVTMKRVYDFSKLLQLANRLNHLAVIEYEYNGLQFPQQYSKAENI